MSLHEDVRDAVRAHTSELYFLLEFVRDIDKYFIAQAEERLSDVLDTVPTNVLDEIREILSETDLKVNPSLEVNKHFLRFMVASSKPVRYPKLLYSAALTHAIAIFESFLSDFLIMIFTYRPDTLKSESTATYENILSFGSMKELIRHLATTKAKKVLDGNIDEVVDKLKKGFNFDVSRFREFKTIREASYRRNVVIHNNGITDKDYCEKITGSQIGVTLSTDFQYIETLVTAIGQFIDRLDNHFSRRMHYKRHPGQNWIVDVPPWCQ
jgi:hypothetical protein